MTWFRRLHEPPPQPPGQPSQPAEDDSPEALRRRLAELVRFINRNAGKLPVEAVVVARQVTDTVREVIDTSGEGELDVYAVVSINGIVGDYLPTTLRSYLNVDPELTEQVGPSGRTPRAALRDQLDDLLGGAEELLHAARSHDVDALFSQGSFLRTKFTGSDLDL